MTISEEKQRIRKEIALQKKQYPAETLVCWSEQIIRLLEQSELFQKANALACYYALPGEVQTVDFLDRWYQKKRMALPVVQGTD